MRYTRLSTLIATFVALTLHSADAVAQNAANGELKGSVESGANKRAGVAAQSNYDKPFRPRFMPPLLDITKWNSNAPLSGLIKDETDIGAAPDHLEKNQVGKVNAILSYGPTTKMNTVETFVAYRSDCPPYDEGSWNAYQSSHPQFFFGADIKHIPAAETSTSWYAWQTNLGNCLNSTWTLHSLHVPPAEIMRIVRGYFMGGAQNAHADPGRVELWLTAQQDGSLDARVISSTYGSQFNDALIGEIRGLNGMPELVPPRDPSCPKIGFYACLIVAPAGR